MINPYMTDQDWQYYISDWRESLSPPGEVVPKVKPAKIKNGSSRVWEYIALGRKTSKAQFFITQEGVGGIFGFWIPKSAILEDNGNHVIVAKWCREINVIEYK